jgi:hypothetical protein
LVPTPHFTNHFLPPQPAYARRRLPGAEANVTAARDALSLYANDRPSGETSSAAAALPRSSAAKGEAETVMPQLNDTFLDRLVSLAKQATESDYRQRLIKQYQDAAVSTVPLEQAVAYEQQVLDQMKHGSGANAPRSDEATVRAEIDSATAEVRTLIVKINEIYRLLSNNLNPSTQLFALAGTPTSRIERTRTLSRLTLYGLLLLLLALPAIVLSCLLHNRVREEEAAQRTVTRATSEEPA